MPLTPVPDDVFCTPMLQGGKDEQADGTFSAYPVSLQDIRDACCQLKSSLQLTGQASDILEEKTRGQSASSLWHESRRLRLTASCFHQIINRRQTTYPSAFLRQQLYSTGRVQTKAMRLGLEREDGAAQRYKLQKQVEGEELTLSEAGLHVCADMGFLGASVDRIARDACGRMILVELKNPDNTWEFENVLDIPQKQKCVSKTACGQRLELNKKHSYYTQVQGQMYVYGSNQCDFVLCTKTAMHTERIERDESFITDMIKKLEAFYDNIYLPEIVYPRIKHGLPPVNLGSLE